MTPESSRQFNMFTNEWDDNRTRRQKELDREREQPKQQEMFSQHEIAQFGVRRLTAERMVQKALQVEGNT